MVENHVEKVENYPLQTTSTLYSPQLYLHSTKSRGKKQVRSQKTALDKEFSHSPAAWGTVGRVRPLLPCPGTAGPPDKCLPNPRKQGFSLPGRPPPRRRRLLFPPRPGAAWPTPPGLTGGRGRRPGQNKKSSASAAKLFRLFSSVPSAPGRRAFTFSGRAFRGKRRCADSSGCF